MIYNPDGFILAFSSTRTKLKLCQSNLKSVIMSSGIPRQVLFPERSLKYTQRILIIKAILIMQQKMIRNMRSGVIKQIM